MKELNDKTALITGAASGIGKALALEFVSAGSKLILLDIDKSGLKKLKESIIKDYGVTPTIIQCDLSVERDIERIPKKILAGTDILVNNAGLGSQGLFVDRSYEEFSHIVAVNYLAPVHLTKRLLSQRDPAFRTAIVNISSFVGFIETPYLSAYSSSKFAVAAFSRCLMMELSDTNVHVMTVYPGPARTSFGKKFGTQRTYDRFYHRFVILQPEDVARSIIGGIKRNRRRVIIPPYLRIPVLFHDLFPSLYETIIQKIQRNRSKEFQSK